MQIIMYQIIAFLELHISRSSDLMIVLITYPLESRMDYQLRSINKKMSYDCGSQNSAQEILEPSLFRVFWIIKNTS